MEMVQKSTINDDSSDDESNNDCRYIEERLDMSVFDADQKESQQSKRLCRPDNFIDDDTYGSSVLVQKKRTRNRRVVVPRLLRRDVRNLYATMFANVYNMMDYKLCSGFFNEYCNPDMKLVCDMTPSLSQQLVHIAPHVSRVTTVDGASIAAEYLHSRSQNYPDMSMNLIDSHIVRLPYCEDSQIISKFTMHGTKLHDTSKWDEMIFNDETTTITNNSDNNSNENKDFNSIDLIFEENPIIETLLYTVESESQDGRKGLMRGFSSEQYLRLLERSPLCDPVFISLEGVLTMNLDATLKVTSFDITYSNVSYRMLSSSDTVVFVK